MQFIGIRRLVEVNRTAFKGLLPVGAVEDVQ